jgi:hypothetical protein
LAQADGPRRPPFRACSRTRRLATQIRSGLGPSQQNRQLWRYERGTRGTSHQKGLPGWLSQDGQGRPPAIGRAQGSPPVGGVSSRAKASVQVPGTSPPGPRLRRLSPRWLRPASGKGPTAGPPPAAAWPVLPYPVLAWRVIGRACPPEKSRGQESDDQLAPQVRTGSLRLPPHFRSLCFHVQGCPPAARLFLSPSPPVTITVTASPVACPS